jgi:hypothetical protein
MIDAGLARRLAELGIRRDGLIHRAEYARSGAMRDLQSLAPVAARIDRVLEALHYLRRHPLIAAIAGALASVVAMRVLSSARGGMGITAFAPLMLRIGAKLLR